MIAWIAFGMPASESARAPGREAVRASAVAKTADSEPDFGFGRPVLDVNGGWASGCWSEKGGELRFDPCFDAITDFGVLIEQAALAEDDSVIKKQVAVLEDYLSRLELVPDPELG